MSRNPLLAIRYDPSVEKEISFMGEKDDLPTSPSVRIS